MDTLSVTVRYRPVRMGWCLRTGDRDALHKALRTTFALWGGRYNPIIPVDQPELAADLVSLFRVDALWPLSDDQAIKDFIAKFKHLPDPFYHDEIFAERGRGRGPLLVDIYHPIRRLYQDHFRHNPNPEITVHRHTWHPDDPLSDMLLCTFGGLPAPEETGTDYVALMKSELRATDVVIENGGVLPEGKANEWRVGEFSRAYLERHYLVTNHWSYPGFYIGSAARFEDIVHFWNLRAADIAVAFFDPAHEARLAPRRSGWLARLRSRPPGRHPSDNSVAIWYREQDGQPDTGAFGAGLTLCRVSLGLWNGQNIKAPYMHFAEGRTLAAIGQNSAGKPRVSFQLPPKPLAEDPDLHNQHLVAAIDPGIGLWGNERETLHAPSIPELNEYYGRECYFEWNKTRVEPGGLGIIISADRDDLSLTALNVTELIRRAFGVVGIKAEPSKPGLVASRLIQQMDGIQGCRAFKIAGVRTLIENHGPQKSFTHGHATKTIWGADTASPLSSYNLFIEPRPSGSKLTGNAVFAYLLKRGVFRAGLRFECPNCQLEFWISLDDIRTDATCEYCGQRFNVTPFLKDRDWAYRRSGLFGRDDNQEGAIPVVLTLQQLDTTLHSGRLLYTAAMTLKPKSAKIRPCETDFVALVPHSREGKIEIVIGECKTRQAIEDDDVAKLQAVAEAFPKERFNVYVVFAKLDVFSEEELNRVRRLNPRYPPRVIILSPPQLDPYYAYEEAKERDGKRLIVVSLSDMARATSQIFLSQPAKAPDGGAEGG